MGQLQGSPDSPQPLPVHWAQEVTQEGTTTERRLARLGTEVFAGLPLLLMFNSGNPISTISRGQALGRTAV